MSALPDIAELATLANQGAALVRGTQGPRTGRGWCLLALRGRLVEISSSGTTAALSAVAALVYEAQRRDEPTAWITTWQATFFPPDLEESGVDLGALPVVWSDEVRSAARAADELLRSGAFGLVVVDLGPHRNVPLPVQAQLSGLVKRHQSTLVFLSRKRREAASLGSLISLRCAGAKWRSAFNRFTWELDVLKDKRQGPGWRHEEVCHGPDGLC
jgi:recombination protein RecA